MGVNIGIFELYKLIVYELLLLLVSAFIRLLGLMHTDEDMKSIYQAYFPNYKPVFLFCPFLQGFCEVTKTLAKTMKGSDAKSKRFHSKRIKHVF